MSLLDLNKHNLHVSAMVQIGRLTTNIHLENLATGLPISDNILYIEYGSKINKGINPKHVPKKKKLKKNFFYNQVTIHIHCKKRVNMKIFNNGRIQMTGINYKTHGKESIQLLINEIHKLSEDSKKEIFDSDSIQQDNDVETVLINSDFDIQFQIDREILHRLIVDDGYYSSYEPCTYPGVNIKYYHNPIINNSGICDCEQPCNGKGKDNTCKKITIAVFKSGKIIITGGRTIENINAAYEFITNFIISHKSKIQVK